jgi:hypothetical protein
MQRRENEVASLGRFHRDFDGLLVPHFSHQDHLGGLPKSGSQYQSKAWSITVQLPLVNDGTFVAMRELHRVFNGKNVVCLGFVDPVENRGQG